MEKDFRGHLGGPEWGEEDGVGTQHFPDWIAR